VRLVRRWVGTALALLVVLAALPATAGAHATLQDSSPQRGAVLERAPGAVTFRFDEAVEGNLGAIRVFDSRGERVDQGDAFHPDGVGSRLSVHLKPRLPDGTYTATYRVISADGHVVSSGLVFSVGHASSGGETVAELLSAAQTGPVTSTAFAITRAVQFAAIAVGGGALLFLLLCWPGADRAGAARIRLLVLAASVAGLLSALAAIVLEGAEAAGVSGWSALDADTLREVLGTRFGTMWAIAAGAWVVLGVLAAATGRRWAGSAPLLAVALLPVAYLVLLPALSGHGSTQSPTGVLFPANALHVGAMTAWVGGLVALLVAVPAATRRRPSQERAGLLASVLVRFSAVALVAVGVLAVTGLVQAFFAIRHLDLVLTTAYGRAVVIKVVLLLGLIGLGALNRRRTVPRLQAAAQTRRSPGEDGVVLRRTLRTEVALLVAVLAVTGALAGYPPPDSAAAGPYAATTRVGPQQLEITVDPARVGANEVHLYLFDPGTGAQLDTAKEVDVSAAMAAKGIGRISQEATKAGPGHYVVPDLPLGVAGTWQVTVTVRVSDFDQFEKVLEVSVR
jgi:copper transport protein